MNYPSGKRKFINGVCFDENKDGSVTVTETYTNENEDSAAKSVATAFQFGLAMGFAKKYDEMDKVMEEVKKAITPEQQLCDDVISRQAVLEKAINIPIAEIVTEDKVICRKVVFVDDIEKLPSVTPQPKTGQKTGHWLRMSDLSEQEDDRYKCSRCGNVIHYKNEMDLYTFNSWCGRCGSDNGRFKNIELESDFEIKTVTNAKEAEAYPINKDITKGFEEFTKMMFKQGQAGGEKE